MQIHTQLDCYGFEQIPETNLVRWENRWYRDVKREARPHEFIRTDQSLIRVMRVGETAVYDGEKVPHEHGTYTVLENVANIEDELMVLG